MGKELFIKQLRPYLYLMDAVAILDVNILGQFDEMKEKL